MKYLCLLSILTFSSVSLAEAAETNQTEKTYRYPADLSEKESITMIGSQGKYDSCLSKEATAVMDKYDDFRQIADFAMETCKTTLTEIDKDLEMMNLDPDFRRFFLRKTSQTSVKKLLPKLMMAKSK